jgi:large subunit ribosomal protein L18
MQKAGRTIRRRRLEGKTDYKARLGMLKSGEKRIVVRKTNRYVIGQIVHSEIAQDKVIVGVNSKQLLSVGWPEDGKGMLKNLSACYLTGYMLGKKSKDTKKAILDLGMQRSIKKSRIFAFLKGIKDSGMEISCNKDIFPDDADIKRGKAKDFIDRVKGEIK